MNKPWNIIEKIIGSIQIVFGVFLIIAYTYTLRQLFEFYTQQYKVDFGNFSYWTLFVNYHYSFLIAFLGIISGILLLKSNSSGWIISTSTWISLSIGTLILSYQQNIKDSHPFASVDKSDTMILLVSGILFSAVVFIMTNAEFRKKV